MRVVIAMFKHETNTFSPVPTSLESFGKDGPVYGRAAYEAFKGTNTPMAAYIDLAEAAGAEIETPIAAEAFPSGPVERTAYRHCCDAICEAVEKGCDALLLDLHGAMVGEETDDGEGPLLARLRAIAPDLPIAKHIVECDGVGVTSSDYSLFPFKKVRRPIYPLDPDAQP